MTESFVEKTCALSLLETVTVVFPCVMVVEPSVGGSMVKSVSSWLSKEMLSVWGLGSLHKESFGKMALIEASWN